MRLDRDKRVRRAVWVPEHPLQEPAIAKAGPGVVRIITHDAPAEIVKSWPDYYPIIPRPDEYAFISNAIIIECETSPDNTNSYLSTILAPASLFKPYLDSDVPMVNIVIDVILASGVVSNNAKLIACDSHYNLAALTLVSDSLLPTVHLKKIHDVISIYPTKQDVLHSHSDLFKVSSGALLFSVWRMHGRPYSLAPASGKFCLKSREDREDFDIFKTTSTTCNEVYYVDRSYCVGTILNPSGEVIGITFGSSSFLPSNLMLRWWSNFKSSREFRRPFTGVEVDNLVDADLDFLAEFIPKFPDISCAVIVTAVMEDSPACHSGIQCNDVIVKLDGKPVRSKLEFYDSIWENSGKAVAFTLRRTITGEELNPTVLIEEASREKFHQWPHPHWFRMKNN